MPNMDGSGVPGHPPHRSSRLLSSSPPLPFAPSPTLLPFSYDQPLSLSHPRARAAPHSPLQKHHAPPPQVFYARLAYPSQDADAPCAQHPQASPHPPPPCSPAHAA
ncbi:hypothetical protein CVT25_015474 [Psilocybe cyanescens]|uniref:Uncharacterized protein n=1 Tax=Psilocybe cyanescens TaxID=93625 RepID=A0A409X595_PSICY|nr:hypothetical protein CVT25_015474 [Psilocybe cyanescens]